jgi:hypothetical protein
MDSNKLGSSRFEKPDLHSAEHACAADGCDIPSIIVLGEKPLCLQHFLTRCYEWLDQLDPAARSPFSTSNEIARVRSLVEECSNRALLVSLRCEALTNLDRSRLLDILLRSSDLLFLLRVPANVSAWLPAYPSRSVTHESPRNLSLDSQLRIKVCGI